MPALSKDRFIALTAKVLPGTGIVYINRFKIVAIHMPNGDGLTPVETEGSTYYVAETPEQVLQLAGFTCSGGAGDFVSSPGASDDS